MNTATNQPPAAVGTLEAVTGQNMTAVAIGDRLYQLKPLTPRNSAAVMAWERERALTEWFQTAKRAGLPGDVVNSQISQMRREDFYPVTASTLGYVLHLRSGAPLDECLDLPQRELLKNESAILDRDEVEEKIEPEAALQALGLDVGELLQQDPEAAAARVQAVIEQVLAELASEKKRSEGEGAAD